MRFPLLLIAAPFILNVAKFFSSRLFNVRVYPWLMLIDLDNVVYVDLEVMVAPFPLMISVRMEPEAPPHDMPLEPSYIS